MTETQNPRPNHRAPLAPGEIRTHTVGIRTFTVMHVANGGLTQTSYRDEDSYTQVIATERFEDVAVRAYADAIEQAESDAIDGLDDADGSMFISSSTGELIDPQATPAEVDPYAKREASVAFNINVLRGLLHGTPLEDDVRAAGLKALDRIATQVPVRAMFKGREVSQHACGAVKYGDGFPDGCSWCYKPGAWQPLYTLGGA